MNHKAFSSGLECPFFTARPTNMHASKDGATHCEEPPQSFAPVPPPAALADTHPQPQRHFPAVPAPSVQEGQLPHEMPQRRAGLGCCSSAASPGQGVRDHPPWKRLVISRKLFMGEGNNGMSGSTSTPREENRRRQD